MKSGLLFQNARSSRSAAFAVVVLFCALITQGAEAQQRAGVGRPLPPSAAAENVAEPGSELTVYLLTMGPGDQVWEMFGHNAIWIHDAARGSDIAYHWGVFDFKDKDFYPNFALGKMRYLMGAFDFRETIDFYRESNRTVWAQELNLTPAQKMSLAQFISWNVRPENKYYRYNYYRDNCSTRVRDAIDGAIGGAIKSTFASVPSGTTFRFHTERLMQGDWAFFTGTMAGLGQPTDLPITKYQEMFLPEKVRDGIRSVRVMQNGVSVPLVKSEQVLYEAARAPEPSKVNRGIGGYLLIAAIILLIGAALFFVQRSGKPTAAIALAAIWSFVAGLSGVVLTALWTVTEHTFSYRNENLFQLNPLSLVVMALLLRALLARREKLSSRLDSAYLWASIVAGISVLGVLLKVLPWFYQSNRDIIALVLPVHMGVALLLRASARRAHHN